MKSTQTPSNQRERIDVNVASALRRLRTEQGLSLRALADASGLSVNTLSLIENGKTSPSVGTLQQVAAALAVPITAFFERETSVQAVVFMKASERPSARFEHGTLANMGLGFSRPDLQPFIITLEPNSGSGPNPIVHTGSEFVMCLSGCVHYTVDGNVYVLMPGDSLLFESHLPHGWHNHLETPSEAVLVLAPSDSRDMAGDRHFAHRHSVN